MGATRGRGETATAAALVALMFCADDSDVKLERPQGINSRQWRLKQLEGQADSFSPHDIRRTCCSDLLSAGTDLLTVQGIMGHANPATTKRYDMRPEDGKRKAAARLHLPL